MLGSLTAVRISRRVRLEQQEKYKKHKDSKGARSIYRNEKEFQNPDWKQRHQYFSFGNLPALSTRQWTKLIIVHFMTKARPRVTQWSVSLFDYSFFRPHLQITQELSVVKTSHVSPLYKRHMWPCGQSWERSAQKSHSRYFSFLVCVHFRSF